MDASEKPANGSPRLFKNPFSFAGRIRRKEYGLSCVIYTVGAHLIQIASRAIDDNGILGLLGIPLVWFILAQGVKRCHDRGKSGWWLLVPLYEFWLLFGEGEPGPNQYGPDPKDTAESPAVLS